MFNRSCVVPGNLPGGSNIRGMETKMEEEVECPLCQKLFPISVIEAHASTCGETVPEVPTQQPVVNSSKGRRRGHQKDEDVTEITDTSDDEVNVPRTISRPNRRERTPPNYERCMHCKGVYKTGDLYLLHVRSCLEGIQASPSTSTNSRAQSKGEQGPTSNHLRVSNVSSVLERLEGGSM